MTAACAYSGHCWHVDITDTGWQDRCCDCGEIGTSWEDDCE
jgi:hypothetical protein